MYQVVITEPDGAVHGKTFKDPIEAVQEFGRYLINPKYERKGQVMFQQLGQLVVVLDDYRLTHAEVLKTKNNQLFVEFHSFSTKEEFVPKYTKYAKFHETAAYTTGALIDLKTQEVVLAFDEDKIYGVEE